MPNHVTNRITIVCADKQSIDEFKDGCITNGAIDFNKIIPLPPFIANGNGLTVGSREDGTGRNWYKFHLDKWGTKWNAYDCSIVEQENKMIITFDTAWSEPEEIVREIHKWFPEFMLTHEYFDEGWGFFGCKRYGALGIFGGTYKDRVENEDLFMKLCIELKGYNPDEDEDEE
ncbi:hypothetical protein V2H33_21955 [Escherichia coli]|uniref:DUF1281 family ferredoxin-like fold protein n=1 Tax=Escherichia coli TaxID=562 RepID=UPI002E9F191B|nr:hypothetical protein [Escherichia coli]